MDETEGGRVEIEFPANFLRIEGPFPEGRMRDELLAVLAEQLRSQDMNAALVTSFEHGELETVAPGTPMPARVTAVIIEDETASIYPLDTPCSGWERDEDEDVVALLCRPDREGQLRREIEAIREKQRLADDIVDLEFGPHFEPHFTGPWPEKVRATRSVLKAAKQAAKAARRVPIIVSGPDRAGRHEIRMVSRGVPIRLQWMAEGVDGKTLKMRRAQAASFTTVFSAAVAKATAEVALAALPTPSAAVH